MKTLTEARAIAIAWLQNYWQPRGRARELGRQYGAMREECPLVLADLKRFCCDDDSTFVQGEPDTTLINQGKREVWLHIKEMLGLDHEDLEHLKEETERG